MCELSHFLQQYLHQQLQRPVTATRGDVVVSAALSRHAALRRERLLPARHELPERHVQPAPAGRPAGAARARLPAIRARAHAGRETRW